MMFFSNPALELEAQNKNRDVLITALATLGVTQAVMTYSGGGDSGDGCNLSITPPEAMPVLCSTQIVHCYVATERQEGGDYTHHPKSRSLSVDEALRDFAMHWVEQHHSGWENNDGGDGTVTVDVPSDTFTLEHVEYYTESSSYEYTC